jgi:hypothetical protein
MVITSINRFYAKFYDDLGREVGKKRFLPTSKNITYKDKSYIYNPSNQSRLKIIYLTHTVQYYFYNINNPEGLKFSEKQKPLLNSNEYNILIEGQVLKNLNNLFKKNFLMDLIKNPVFIIGVIIFIGFIYYLNKNGGKLW